MHKVTLKPITQWFEKALPKPTQKDINVQVGVHIEEFAEMLEAMGHIDYAEQLHLLAANYKDSHIDFVLSKENKVKFLDALADQVVTATANAHVNNFAWDNALTEVNQSNFSKFEDGNPIFNENGKIMKGKDYKAPNLEPFIKQID